MRAGVEAALAAIAAQPRAAWGELVRAQFGDDPALARQALLWLFAGPCEAGPPSLGPGAERFDLAVALGTGGTASVWRAYDNKLGRDVAIKVFHGATPETLRQILAEARASSEVISEHVVRVYDVHDADPPYLVLELVGEHDPLRGAVEPGMSAAACRPRDVTEAVTWMRDVAYGVHDAHLRNVFHRDLKPHNVLITPISRRAKIADFGIAVSAHHAPARGRSLVLGTPPYMAPEQARGLPATLDPRAAADRAALVAVDVWGLGALGYELLSGAPPWRADGASAAWELAASGQAPPELDRAVPRRLRRIVMRALAVDPAQRYASARELAADLDAFLDRRPTSFDRGAGARLVLWARRNPHLTVTAAVAVALAGMSLGAYSTMAALRARGRELAAENREVEAEKTKLAARMHEARRELDDTEAALRGQGEQLATMRHTLDDTRAEYQTIVAAKGAATRDLSDQLANARGDRDVAEQARVLYERFWTHARADATQAVAERDAARTDRDRMAKERDAALAARAAAERERDTARSERDAARADRDRAEANLAEVTGAAHERIREPATTGVAP